MTKMKKLFAVVLALAMLVTMASFSASAEATTSVDMKIWLTSQTNEFDVKINAAEDVGGLTATLEYAKDVVEYVSFSGAESSNNVDDTVKDNKDGTMEIVLLGNKISLKFKFVSGANAVTFKLTNIVASNLNGTAKLTADDVTSTADTVVAEGNTIRNTEVVEKQDLGFVSTFIGAVVPEGATDVYLGFVAIPTAMLGEDTLTLDTVEKGAINSEVLVDRNTIVEEGAEYVAHITGFLQGNETDGYDYSRMGRKLSGRFYIKYTVDSEEKIFYSNNNSASPEVVNGEISKSFVGTCKAMAAAILNSGKNYDYTDELGSYDAVQAILDATSTDDTQKANILKFVIANAEILEQLEAQ